MQVVAVVVDTVVVYFMRVVVAVVAILMAVFISVVVVVSIEVKLFNQLG